MNSGTHLATVEELRAADRLPSPQGVALEVVRLTRSDNFTNAQLAHIVQADPALCGRLIRAANSAALGSRRPVAAVSEAILVLGIPAVRQLVLSFSLVSRYRRGACAHFDYHAFWSRSLLLAVAAQKLCTRLRAAAPEEVFACGLLANIGRLALATLYPQEYDRVLADALEADVRKLLEQEREALGIDHAALGTAMLEDWCFPSLFIAAVRARLAPQDAGFAEGSRLLVLARAFQLSEAVADLCMLSEAERRAQMPAVLFDAARLAIDGEELEDMILAVQAEWSEWAQILDVPAEDVPPAVAQEKAPASNQAELKPGLSRAMRLRVLDVGVKDPAMVELRRQAEQEGHSLVSVANAKQALAMMMHVRPHAILLSLDLPEDSAAGLVKALRTTDMAAQTYILIAARSGQEAKALAALSHGADDVLNLPLAPGLLIARLRAAQRMLGQQIALTRSLDEIRKFSRELALNNRRLQQQLHTDELTGLPNMRYCRDRLEQAWAAVRRRQGDLAVFVVDLDHFKRVNETHGHAIGDEVLCRAGMLLRSEARLQDVVCRTGGAEFTVLCPDTGSLEAQRCAERLRLALESHSADPERGLPAVTASVGIAIAEQELAEADDLLRRAGRSLYRAKSAGRNRVSLWEAKSAAREDSSAA